MIRTALIRTRAYSARLTPPPVCSENAISSSIRNLHVSRPAARSAVIKGKKNSSKFKSRTFVPKNNYDFKDSDDDVLRLKAVSRLVHLRNKERLSNQSSQSVNIVVKPSKTTAPQSGKSNQTAQKNTRVVNWGNLSPRGQLGAITESLTFEVVNDPFNKKVLDALLHIMEANARKVRSDHSNNGIYYLGQKLKSQLQAPRQPIAEFSLETLINPQQEQLADILYHIYQHDKTIRWPQPLVAKHQIGTSLDSKFLYILNRVLEDTIRFSKIMFSPSEDSTIDISNPTKWFPMARQLKRKIIMHVGPTNSGKTYHALKKLEKSKSGYFAGPLRLLAREVYERFRDKNIRCNLITGEEIIEDIDANGKIAGLSSGTVEMISTVREYDVVVLDEIQMIADESRGWAWTQALIGVRAKEIHLCGEASAVPLIKKICKLTGDDVEVNYYERLGKLEVERQPLGVDNLEGLEKGDCVVAFSKTDILKYKAQIEEVTGKSVAVIYGGLPAETRVQQANDFNTGKAEILVASDAIGMGLNLSIKRVIFSKVKKFDGVAKTLLTVSQLKQIAGRAGRYKVAPTRSSQGQNTAPEPVFDVIEDEKIASVAAAAAAPVDKKGSTGYVTAFKRSQLEIIKSHLTADIEYLKKACIWPPDHIWGEYVAGFPTGTSLKEVLAVYSVEVESSELFFSSSTKSRELICEMFDGIQHMMIGDQLKLLTAPMDNRQQGFAQLMVRAFCETIANSDTKSIFDFALPFHLIAETKGLYGGMPAMYKGKDLAQMDLEYGFGEEPTFGTSDPLAKYLKQLEIFHKMVMLFCWLSYRYPKYFVDREGAVDIKHLCEFKISEALASMNRANKFKSYKNRASNRSLYGSNREMKILDFSF